jgi:hypothetical protein
MSLSTLFKGKPAGRDIRGLIKPTSGKRTEIV